MKTREQRDAEYRAALGLDANEPLPKSIGPSGPGTSSGGAAQRRSGWRRRTRIQVVSANPSSLYVGDEEQ